VKDLKPDYECLRRKVSKVRQDKAVFSGQEVLTNIFER
jgi:hypothetical protein